MQIHHLLSNQFAQVLLVAVSLLSEVCSQNVVSCTPVNNTRKCDTGLVSQQDVITVACSLDKSAVGKPNTAEFSVRSGNANFEPICIVRLSLCLNVPNVDCGCVSNPNSYDVYLNKTAESSFNGADVRLSWGTDTDTVKIGEVEDPASAVCTLNDEEIQDNSEFRTCKFEMEEDSHVRYCCSSALSPVKTRISFNNAINNDSRCAVIDRSQAGEGVYTFSSTICGILAHNGSCNATIKPDPCPTFCIIIIPVVIGGCLIGVVVAVICLRKKKKLCFKEKKQRSEDEATSNSERTVGYVSKTPEVEAKGNSEEKFKMFAASPGKDEGKHHMSSSTLEVVVIRIQGNASLSMLEERVKQDLRKKRLNIPKDCENVFKYGDAIESDKSKKLGTLFHGHMGDIKVTVKVLENGIFEIQEGVSVGSSQDSPPKP